MKKTRRILALALVLTSALCFFACGGPTPEPTPDMSPLPDEWFADAAVFGDSISVTLQKYCEKTGELGDILFLCEFSYSVHNAISGQVKVWYQTEQYAPQDVLPVAGVNKVFIMLGVNDVALYGGVDKTMELWDQFIDNLREKSPDLTIFIESCLPVYWASQFDKRNNELLDDYNDRLAELCQEKDCVYVDVAHYLKDDRNSLAEEYCSDEYVHITEAAAQVWAEQLKNPANYSVNPREIDYGTEN